MGGAMNSQQKKTTSIVCCSLEFPTKQNHSQLHVVVGNSQPNKNVPLYIGALGLQRKGNQCPMSVVTLNSFPKKNVSCSCEVSTQKVNGLLCAVHVNSRPKRHAPLNVEAMNPHPPQTRNTFQWILQLWMRNQRNSSPIVCRSCKPQTKENVTFYGGAVASQPTNILRCVL